MHKVDFVACLLFVLKASGISKIEWQEVFIYCLIFFAWSFISDITEAKAKDLFIKKENEK